MLSGNPKKRPEADVILSEHFQRKVVDEAIDIELVDTNSRVDFHPSVIAGLPVLIDPKSNRHKAIPSRRQHAATDTVWNPMTEKAFPERGDRFKILEYVCELLKDMNSMYNMDHVVW